MSEAVPTLAAIPGHPREDYVASVLERFANGGVRDQIARLCIDGSAKFPTFLIPTIAAQLELGGPIERAATALAGWARYLGVVDPADQAFDADAAMPRGAMPRTPSPTRWRSSSTTPCSRQRCATRRGSAPRSRTRTAGSPRPARSPRWKARRELPGTRRERTARAGAAAAARPPARDLHAGAAAGLGRRRRPRAAATA